MPDVNAAVVPTKLRLFIMVLRLLFLTKVSCVRANVSVAGH
jgi:hypothetical protein